MLALRPIVVDETNTVLGGNMRIKALQEAGYTEVPGEWIKKASELTDEQKSEFIIKDNVGFGEWDWGVLVNEWDEDQLTESSFSSASSFSGKSGISSPHHRKRRYMGAKQSQVVMWRFV